MKPVLILQHLHQDGPAYLARWLQARGRRFEVFNTEAGQDFPDTVDGYAAMAVLGGEMSANDPLPSLRHAERLILDAIDADVPVLGHCLGGQLMARALGAKVVPSPAPEIGWHPIRVVGPAAATWFGDSPEPVVFQWHYDAFELPPRAQLLASSGACPHQAFAVGPHLAMQFHVELDDAKLRAWVAAHDERFLAASHAPTVHDGPTMLNDAGRRLRLQQALADRVYARWLAFADTASGRP
ncbi:type 1 glutamine amidotransferase [Piscinibacter sp. XHJ-5]|uniref:type 1 glutamine amidotransferase n=1 Tax=Piscinibacter sp. XHJ-5 TaxID=3037797 RepID=UPI002452BF1F|nr:type 1 glutamine amidotransferase [Piscinibacter sp. XHJ-5]